MRGPNVMQGYWNAPAETNRFFRPINNDGKRALYTVDLFRKDKDGFLYYVLRKDDLIKINGNRVSPKEIENTLYRMEGVLESAAIGIPDNITGQAIKVFIVNKSLSGLTAKQVQRFCQQNLEAYMVPKHVELREQLSKSSSGKIDKKRLG